MTSEYHHWLILSLCITWIFSLGMGLWQAAVHHVGPAEDDLEYNLCGAAKVWLNHCCIQTKFQEFTVLCKFISYKLTKNKDF